MGTTGTTGLSARQEWLEGVETTLQRAIQKGYERAGPRGRRIKNARHGTWLGHLLHAVLTDVPETRVRNGQIEMRKPSGQPMALTAT